MEIIKDTKLTFKNDDLEAYSNELFNKILNSKYYPTLVEQGRKSEEIKNNVSKFNDYIDDLEISDKIKTYDDCVKYNKFQRVILTLNNGIIEREYVPLKPYQDYVDYLSHFIVSDFDKEYVKADFKKVEKRAQAQILNAIKNNRWLYLNGAIRSGRTYAAMSIVNAKYAKRDFKIVFASSQKLFANLNNLYFKDQTIFKEDMESYCYCDVLVLDDFGSEYKNQLIRDSYLLPILKNRAANGKMTIFTSDFDIKTISKLYSFTPGTDVLGQSLGKLIISQVEKEITMSNVSIY